MIWQRPESYAFRDMRQAQMPLDRLEIEFRRPVMRALWWVLVTLVGVVFAGLWWLW